MGNCAALKEWERHSVEISTPEARIEKVAEVLISAPDLAENLIRQKFALEGSLQRVDFPLLAENLNLVLNGTGKVRVAPGVKVPFTLSGIFPIVESRDEAGDEGKLKEVFLGRPPQFAQAQFQNVIGGFLGRMLNLKEHLPPGSPRNFDDTIAIQVFVGGDDFLVENPVDVYISGTALTETGTVAVDIGKTQATVAKIDQEGKPILQWEEGTNFFLEGEGVISGKGEGECYQLDGNKFHIHWDVSVLKTD